MASGTQSPPLEATGEDKLMGASSVDTPDAKAEVVPDSEQRARTFSSSAVTESHINIFIEYFQEPKTVSQKQAAVNQKVYHPRPMIRPWSSFCLQSTMGETVSARLAREGRSID